MRLFFATLPLLLPTAVNAAESGALPAVASAAWYGMYAGVLSVIMLFSLSLWAWHRDRAHLWLAVTAILMGCAALLFSGFAIAYLPPYPALPGMLLAVFSVLASASAMATLDAVLRLRETLPVAKRLLPYIAGAGLAVLPLLFFAEASTLLKSAQLIALLLLAASMVMAGAVFMRQPGLRFHAAAFWPLHIGGMAFFLHGLGMLDGSDWLNHALETGSALHMVLLSILLASRARQAEREQEVSRRKALESALKSERLLEQRVGERTTELFQANSLLQIEINERRKLEKDLQAALTTERNALRAQRQFVSMVSHEFRTPLAIIDTTAQRLDTALGQHMPELAPRITKIRRAVARLLTLIDNCLSEDRLSTHDMTLRLEVAPPEKLLRRVSQDAPLDRPERIRIELADGLRPVMCDAHLIGIALTNLVKNALNYSPPDTVITLRARAGEHSLEIEVDDEGPGVAPEEKEAIFDKFYRSERTQTVSGAGLGLYLCREIARSHGGDVTLAEKHGPGACFRLTLPYATEEDFIPQAV